MRLRAVAAGAATLLVTLALGAVWPALAAAAVVFDATPAADTNQTSATFRFHDSAGGSPTFQCSLDSAAFSACTSPVNLSSLSEGQQSFSVRVSSGAAPPPPATYTWTVDLTPPTTQVTGQPPALSNSATATFTFTSPDLTATFRCSLNGAAAQPCTSPVVYTGLADATRSLLIQAVDPAGNVDPTAQPIVWTVDTTPPDTTLANPGNVVAKNFVVFSFTSSEAGSTFECAFGNATFSTCTSPDVVDVPGSGAHVFKVRATDAAGNADPTPAVYRWTSDLTPPKPPKVTIFPALVASASSAAPVPVATGSPGVGTTFTNPVAKLLSTPRFTLSTRLHAQWSSDPTATSYDVTIESVPQDSTGMGIHGENELFIKQYAHTKRTALTLHEFLGTTVCVKVSARDKVGNVSKTRTACTTIPAAVAPPWGPYTFQRVRDAKAFRGYYIVLTGAGLVQDIGDDAFFSPTHVALDAERCGTCGVVEIDFMKFGGARLRTLASVDLNGSNKSSDFSLIDVSLPARRVERDGEGLLVIRAASGHPRLAAIGITN